jgi:glycosyltransferase involved in cell wall biosynthesis
MQELASTTTLSPPSELPLRVLHVAQPTIAGVMVVVRELLRDQQNRGWDVALACPDDGTLHEEALRIGVKWHEWPATRSPGASVVRETRRLRGIISDYSPAVVHLHSSKAGLAGRLAVRGRIPTVFEPNAWSFLAVSGLVRSAALYWERAAARWTHATVCVSDDELRTGSVARIKNPLHVIRNGIDLEEWPEPVANDAVLARRDLGLPPNVPIVVTVGRLCRQKGQDLLLQAWPEVVAQFPDARLILVGEGELRAELERVAPSSVHFVGASNAVRDWYLSADVIVMPSRWEGLSLALLEAMATRRAIVAFCVSGMADALSDGCGLLVHPECTSELAASLKQLLNNNEIRSEMAARARRRAEAQFDIRHRCSRIAQLYDELIKQ